MKIKLSQRDVEFLQVSGVDKTKDAAYHFVRTKLVEGGRVPDRGHPVFKAMKAVGADGRESLEREFSIPKNTRLKEVQIDMVVENIMGWLRGEIQNSGKTQAKLGEFWG